MEPLGTTNSVDRAISRSQVYKLLAKSFQYPSDQFFQYFQNPGQKDLLRQFLSKSSSHRDTAVFLESLDSETFRREELELEYNRLFAHLGSAKCPPYETEYGYENVFQKTQAMADIAGFYRAYGLEPSEMNTDRVDFIGTELEFLSYLAMNEAYARSHGIQEQLDVVIDTQKKFLSDHAGRWVGAFARNLTEGTEHLFYRSVGAVVRGFLKRELALFKVEPERESLGSKQEHEPSESTECQYCTLPRGFS